MIRELNADEVDGAISLVNRVFLRFVSPDFDEQGRVTFANYMRHKADDYAADIVSGYRRIWGYFDGSRLCGVIALRGDSHISLLFVVEPYQHRGIATELLKFLRHWLLPHGARYMTVNSAPGAVGFYEKCGFVAVGEMQQKDGIRHLPMEYKIR